MNYDGVTIEHIGGNCPVQAEGTFDGVPFYFRARGSSVYCVVGGWEWCGPEYEWPDAGWISEDLARAYVHEAYGHWLARDSQAAHDRAGRKRHNDYSDRRMEHIMWAARLDNVEGAAPVIVWHMAQANEISLTMRKDGA